MDPKAFDKQRVTPLALRSGLLGWAWGAITFAGSTVALTSAIVATDLAVVTATTLVAVAVGLWVGAADMNRRPLPFRDRWLAAASLTALASAFGSVSDLYTAIFPGPHWTIGGLIIGIAVPSYALGMLPPLLLADADEIREADPDEGEALGSGIGIIAISILVGAATSVLVTAFVVLPVDGSSTLLMLTALALLLPITRRARSAGVATELTIFETQSPYGHLRVTEVAFPGERQPERRLYLNDEEESGELVRSGAPTLAYIAAAENWLNSMTTAGAEYLFLGGGAYTLPRRIAERDRDARVTVVELDPEITRIAQQFFGLKPQHPIRSIHGDARAYLDSTVGGSFDRIYVDVYDGRESLPHSLVTVEAAERLLSRLKTGGLVGMNVIGYAQPDESLQVWSVIRTFAQVFPGVAVYLHRGRDFPDAQNFLLVGSPEAERNFPIAAGLFERWPREEWPDLEGLATFHDLSIPRSTSAGDRMGRAG